MTLPDLQFGLATRADANALLDLYRDLYPGLGWSREFLGWQYYDNPNGEARVWVARSGDRVLATYVAIPHQVWADGEAHIGWRVQDVMTHPECRGHGVYNRLAAMAPEALFVADYPLNFTFPNEQSHNGFIRNGWVAGFRLPLSVARRTDVHVPAGDIGDLSSISAFDEADEAVWRVHRSRIRYAIDRTVAYLNWRYVRNPKGGYGSYRLKARDDSAVVTLKFFAREDGSRWSHLCDLMTTSDSDEMLLRALRLWMRHADENGCDRMSCWNPLENRLQPLLEAAGFYLQKDLTRYLVLHRSGGDQQSREVADQAQWHLTMGDADVY